MGSPTTYPAILAALGWLVDLLQYDAAACENDPELGAGLMSAGIDGLTAAALAGAAGESGFFFGAVKQCYEHFLAGEDEAVDAIDAKVAEAFAVKHRALEAEMESLRAGNAALVAETAALRGVASTLPALTAQQSVLAADITSARRGIVELEVARDAGTASIARHTRTLTDKGACGSCARAARAHARAAATRPFLPAAPPPPPRRARRRRAGRVAGGRRARGRLAGPVAG